MIKTILYYGISIYIVLLVLAYFLTNHFMFFPGPASYQDRTDIIKIQSSHGKTISALYLHNPEATYTLLISHGNAEDLGDILPMMNEFYQHGFSVFAYDYQGYGTSEGRPTTKNTLADANAAFAYLTQKLNVPTTQIILYGNSIGAALAVDLGTRHSVAGVILQSPFISAYRVLTYLPILPFDKFNNLAKISKIHVPILIIHGSNDRIISVWHGKKLFAHANEPKQAYWVKNAGHNNVRSQAGEDYWETLQNFIQTKMK